MNEKTTQRDHMRVVLAAAARLNTDYFLTPPQSLTIQGAAFNDGPYSLDMNFHRSPEGLAAWADALGLAVVVTTHGTSKRPYAEASGETYGTQVRMWALGDEAEFARYLAVASVPDVPAGLPAEWSVAVSA